MVSFLNFFQTSRATKRFQKTILSVPCEYRCIQSSPGQWDLPLGHCLLGVPQSEDFGWTLLAHLPQELKGIRFYLGDGCTELIADFANSAYPKNIEKLAVGNACFDVGDPPITRGRDYVEIVKRLSVAHFPKLKDFELGVWELFSNSHPCYGKLGDVTKVLQHCPNVEHLGLFGSFELSRALRFDCLKEINVAVEDVPSGAGCDFVNGTSFNRLLESTYPLLEEAVFDFMFDDNSYGYRFPDSFLEGKNMPNLKRLEIAGGFLSGEKERLLESPIGSRNDVVYDLEYMSVS